MLFMQSVCSVDLTSVVEQGHTAAHPPAIAGGTDLFQAHYELLGQGLLGSKNVTAQLPQLYDCASGDLYPHVELKDLERTV